MSDHCDRDRVADRHDLSHRVRAALIASREYAALTPDQAGDQAQLALDLAASFAHHRDAFEEFVADHDVSFEEWMWNLPATIAAAGLPDDAVAAADALGGIDTANQRTYAGDAATILAGAGRHDQAQARVNANIARWPDDPRVWIQAGEATASMDTADKALACYHQAARVAEQGGDPDDVFVAYDALTRYLNDTHANPDDIASARQSLRAWQQRTGSITAQAIPTSPVSHPKVGRNQPCPCGSGRKYKHCCGPTTRRATATDSDSTAGPPGPR